MEKIILVFVLICPGDKDYYSDRLYYSAALCKEAAFGTAVNVYLSTKKKCEYKCVPPDFTPQEAK